MSKHLIVTVGGSGQMVLHYYTQLFLLGLVKEPFYGIAVDTDRPIASLQYLKRFFGTSRLALGERVSEENIPFIENATISTGGLSAKVRSRLGYYERSDDERYEHPAQAFFTSSCLEQRIDEGLFARPCLSAVIALDDLKQILNAFTEKKLDEGSRIVVVTSCVGGTGTGLSLPILDHLQTATQNDVLRLVLLGNFFESDTDVLAKANARFESNKVLYLQTLKEMMGDLHSFAFIEEPRMTDRNSTAEAAAHNLPWPQLDKPYWRAVCALHYLLTETTREARRGFLDKEVPEQDYLSHRNLDYGAALNRRTLALGRVQAIIRHNVLEHLFAEAVPSRIWGGPFTQLMNQYYRAVQIGTGAAAGTPETIASNFQRTAELVWEGGENSYGLSHVFPRSDFRHGSAREIRGIAWPDVRNGIVEKNFSNLEDSCMRVASAVLLSALRFGGQA